MRVSAFPLTTTKETPAEAEVISHQLMLRAGLVRRLASGLYVWTPLGLKVVRKVEAIVREEMEAAGALELSMPVVQPAELWQESGRWEQYGPELARFHDRHDREFCLGPTHEEVITDFVRQEIKSYKQLPLCYYQIQTKFRDEIRPRFGIMRAREFTMKDAYSFHMDQASLQNCYERMYEAYSNIFGRLGLNFRAVEADTGSIGGNASHEFHVLADSGEDDIVFSDSSDYAANIELAPSLPCSEPRPTPSMSMSVVDTPNAKSIEQVCQALNIAAATTTKTLLVKGTDTAVVALVLRGDHSLNDIKAQKLEQVAEPFAMATDEQIRQACGAGAGSIGPVGLNTPIIADHAALALADFVCGANKDGQHLQGVNWGRDLPEPVAADLRNVQAGDPSPDGNGTLSIARGIEVGHIFQLGQKYSTALGAKVLNENGAEQVVTMGCYGIGVTRVVAAAIEQNHDDNGICWPQALAPFQVSLVPIGYQKSATVAAAADQLYAQLRSAGVEVLMDDRKARPGFMFADHELIGIPHRLVIGERGLKEGQLEYRGRRDDASTDLAVDETVEFILQRLVN